MQSSQHVIAVVGGATAGAETAGMLVDSGSIVVVFDQNARPYGKIEDGLPRWHVKLRQKEYQTVDEKLSRPEVHFVPLTKIGCDIDFHALATEWGFTAVILAVGAWKDRPLPIDGADQYLGRGLIYQNPFIYWFNHFFEPDFSGPHYHVEDGAIVVGGGLASLDVVKVLQIETVRLALAQRGIHADMLRLEHAGVPAILAQHGLSWASLGLKGATLFYRRRIEDMPLADAPEDADAARRRKFGATRRRIVEKAMEKYCFHVQPQRAPVGLIVDNERLAGLRFQHTQLKDGRVIAVEGAIDEVHSPQVISSIGSIPVPIAGIPQRGEVYDFTDLELGRVAGYDTVFGAGNAVTGKGNILASRKHSIQVSTHLIEQFLGLGKNNADHRGEEAALDTITAPVDESVQRIAAWVSGRPPADAGCIEAILRRVRERQQAVDYTGTYGNWMQRHGAANAA
jgi:hypothetical protein